METLKGIRETLLVVDDDESVLRVVVAMLEHANFRVFSAQNGAGAMKLAGEMELKIHLLLSDIDMPQMSGPDLASALKITRPDIRVMLMSGGNNGLLVLSYGWAYIQKPFLNGKLVQMVTNVLHSEDRSQLGHEFDTRKDIRNDLMPIKRQKVP
jgi:DNA-binding NtrC family response regulator